MKSTLLIATLLLPVPLLALRAPQDEASPEKLDSAAFQLDDVVAGLKESGHAWNGFLNVPDLFAGVYRLPAGSTDGQSPHADDEIYYVVSGKATLTAGDEEVPVRAGSIAYVAKGVEHRFHDIEEDLVTVAFFARTCAERDPKKATTDSDED